MVKNNEKNTAFYSYYTFNSKRIRICKSLLSCRGGGGKSTYFDKNALKL